MDVYNSKFAKLMGKFFHETTYFAVTTSKNTTRYSCNIEMVNNFWRKHEEVHKKQFERMGWFRFVISYFFEFIKNGYKNNKYEIEARSISIEYEDFKELK